MSEAPPQALSSQRAKLDAALAEKPPLSPAPTEHGTNAAFHPDLFSPPVQRQAAHPALGSAAPAPLFLGDIPTTADAMRAKLEQIVVSKGIVPAAEQVDEWEQRYRAAAARQAAGREGEAPLRLARQVLKQLAKELAAYRAQVAKRRYQAVHHVAPSAGAAGAPGGPPGLSRERVASVAHLAPHATAPLAASAAFGTGAGTAAPAARLPPPPAPDTDALAALQAEIIGRQAALWQAWIRHEREHPILAAYRTKSGNLAEAAALTEAGDGQLRALLRSVLSVLANIERTRSAIDGSDDGKGELARRREFDSVKGSMLYEVKSGEGALSADDLVKFEEMMEIAKKEAPIRLRSGEIRQIKHVRYVFFHPKGIRSNMTTIEGWLQRHRGRVSIHLFNAHGQTRIASSFHDLKGISSWLGEDL